MNRGDEASRYFGAVEIPPKRAFEINGEFSKFVAECLGGVEAVNPMLRSLANLTSTSMGLAAKKIAGRGNADEGITTPDLLMVAEERSMLVIAVYGHEVEYSIELKKMWDLQSEFKNRYSAVPEEFEFVEDVFRAVTIGVNAEIIGYRSLRHILESITTEYADSSNLKNLNELFRLYPDAKFILERATKEEDVKLHIDYTCQLEIDKRIPTRAMICFDVKAGPFEEWIALGQPEEHAEKEIHIHSRESHKRVKFAGPPEKKPEMKVLRIPFKYYHSGPDTDLFEDVKSESVNLVYSVAEIIDQLLN